MSEELIKLESNRLKIFESTYMFFQESFSFFEIDKLIINLSEQLSDYFQIYYSFSFDKINYADFQLKEKYVNPTEPLPYFIAIYFKKIIPDDLHKPLQLTSAKNTPNVKSDHIYIEIDSITYDNIPYNLFDESVVKLETFYQIINQFPRWNFYDGQNVTVNRWLAQCNSIAEMYGHTCIYFKTEPVDTETIDTLSNHSVKNVINIKKLHILFPGNNLPENRNSYSEWDMPLIDDVVIHVVKQKFEQAFGPIIPDDKDFLYLPLLNKMFRVSGMQPKVGFMGKTAWYEVFLIKYEEDSSILIDENLKQSMESTSDFDEALQNINEIDDTLRTAIFDELNLFKLDTIETSEKIDKATIDEKKQATQNFTNKLVDSNNYISLKETDVLREFYDRRLKIISINPDTSAFPISMYDCTLIEKRVIALQYKLGDYNIKNKLSLTVENQFKLDFNMVLLNRFQGEIFDILMPGLLSLYTLKINRANKFEIGINLISENFLVDYALQLNELYNIQLEWKLISGTTPSRQISIKIFKLLNSEKSLEYQNVYIEHSVNTPIQFSNIHLFGGYFYVNDITFGINNKEVMKDHCNPLLIMKQF